MAKNDNDLGLTQQQILFCNEYIADRELNVANAYMKAYPKCKTVKNANAAGSRLLANVNVASYIKELMEERTQRVQYTADDVIRDLLEVKNRCMTAEPVKQWDYDAKEMCETGEYVFDSKGANQALKLLGDHLGMFNKNKLEISGSIQAGVTIIDDIPKED